MQWTIFLIIIFIIIFFCQIVIFYFFFLNNLGHCELLYDTVEDEENHVKVMHKAKRKARERKTPKVINY